MWLQVYEVDFNNPMGFFAIEEDAPDYVHGDAFPHVGEDVVLVNMEAKTHDREGHFYDAGFGMVCKVTKEDRVTMPDGRVLRFYETDHFDRRFRNKS